MLNTVSSMLDGLPGSSGRRLRRARMIACDLDGTLLNRDEIIAPTTAAMIRKVIDLGVPFVMITARHHHAVEPFAEELRLTEPIVSLDGAMTAFPHSDAPRNTITFDREFALDILEEIAITPGVDFCAVTGAAFLTANEEMHLPSRYLHWNIERQSIGSPSEVRGDILEVIGVGTFQGANAVYNYIETRMKKGELKLRLYESHSRADTWFLEVRSARATKLHALEELVASQGIAIRDVIGIGDHRNDIDFCSKVGYVVAVNNAVRELKELADFITERDCNAEGINEFFELYLRARGIDPTPIVRAAEPVRGGRVRSR